LEISNKIKDTYGIFAAKINLARCYIELGDYTEAKGLINEFLSQTETTKNNLAFLLNAAKGLLGTIEISSNTEKAIEYLEEANELDKSNLLIKNYTSQFYPYLTEAYLIKILINRPFNEITKQERHKVKLLCMKALKETKSWNNQYGKALLVSAKYYMLINKSSCAKKYFLKSIAHHKKFNLNYEFAKSCFEYGNFLRKNAINEAIIYYQQAYQIFLDLNEKIYCQKCRELLGIQTEEAKNPLNELTVQDRLKSDRRMEAVLMNSRDISSILDIDELIKKIMENAIELVGAERGLLLLYPEIGEKKITVKSIT